VKRKPEIEIILETIPVPLLIIDSEKKYWQLTIIFVRNSVLRGQRSMAFYSLTCVEGSGISNPFWK
jgi:hypothetical protein